MLVHYNWVEEGRHFAAGEQPQILSQEAARHLQVTALISAL